MSGDGAREAIVEIADIIRSEVSADIHFDLCGVGRAAELILALLASRLAGEGEVVAPASPSGRVLEAGCDAAWPGAECVYDDNFDGPEQQLLAGYRAIISSYTKARRDA